MSYQTDISSRGGNFGDTVSVWMTGDPELVHRHALQSSCYYVQPLAAYAIWMLKRTPHFLRNCTALPIDAPNPELTTTTAVCHTKI